MWAVGASVLRRMGRGSMATSLAATTGLSHLARPPVPNPLHAGYRRASIYVSTSSSGIVPLSSFPDRSGFDLVAEAKTSKLRTPYNRRLVWRRPPRNVIIIKKLNTPSTTAALNDAATWLTHKGLNVLIEPGIAREHPHLKAFDPVEKDHLVDVVDFIVTFGGDGTILHLSSVFQREVPPVIAFSMGTVGFMTPFGTPIAHVLTFETEVEKLLMGRSSCASRTRLAASFCDGLSRQPIFEYHFLNELAVHRGNNLRITHIDMMLDGLMVTRVQGDGVIVSTPTGSTAYSLSAGGCMVHPAIHAILVTPICPRSLSFRPTIFPIDAEITLKVVSDADTMVALDGQTCHTMQCSDFVVVRESPYPLLSVNRTDETTDWVSDINERLHFNQLPSPRFVNRST